MILNKVNIVVEVPEDEEVIIEKKDRRTHSLKEISEQNNDLSKIQNKSDMLSNKSNLQLIKMIPYYSNDEIKNKLLAPEQKKNINLDELIETTEIEKDTEEKAIGFWKAWLLPGVIPFAI
jgi:hypothetical protein